jgi:phenylacetate-CoA ligase
MNQIINKYLIYYPTVFARRQWVPYYLTKLRKSQWLSTDELTQIRFDKLRSLLLSAKQSIPYYQKALKGIDIAKFDSIHCISELPLLTKDLLKGNINSLYSNLRGATSKTTGGSTGNPVTVYKSAVSIANAYAAYWRGYEWAGVSIGDRQARFWGFPNDPAARRHARLTDFITNRYRCIAFQFDENDLHRYYNDLNQFKPGYFYGYVSMLEAFAKFLLKNKLRLKFDLKCVISTSEVLTDVHRKLFQEAFNCKIFNEYGCGEIGTIAHECGEGKMHISAENVLVEILADGSPAEPGEEGEIVVTELNNTLMPLIRLNLKDIGAIDPKPCACGRGLPVLKKVVGRAYDTIYNREGRAFHGEFYMYIFEELQRMGIVVAAFQVIQNSHDDFTIKLVTSNEKRAELERYMNQRVHSTYGSYARLNFEYVTEIAREPSGKIRLIKSLVAQNL